MTPLPRVVAARELIDEADVEPATLASSLDDVAAVNRWLGGTRAAIRGIDELLGNVREASILDVGCGAGDIALSIARRGRQRGVIRRITALDRHAVTASIAQRRTAGEDHVRVLRGDALALPFRDGTFDVAVLSLTLHHLAAHDLVPCLRELGRVAAHGVVVNELHRSAVNYLGARLLAATLWRRRPITRHDGPLSVLRGFTTGELRELAGDAGLLHARVRRRFFYRVVLIGEAPARDAAASTV